MNILIVEDEIAMADSLKIGLENIGYRAIKAHNGQQALELITHGDQEIHLVVTDYLMPIMDGLELMKVLHREVPTLPVIIMTAYAEKNLIIEALKNRCEGFIEKPFSLDQLAAEIVRVRSLLLQNSTSNDLRQLFSRIAHQINNPLTSINGYAQLIKLKWDNGKMVQAYAEKICNAVKLINHINKDLMNVGWTKEDTFEPVELNTLLDGCLEMFHGILFLKGVQVEKNTSQHGLWVMGNRFSLEHIFNNLISNAIDAMEDRSDKTLTVSLRSSQDLSSAEGIIEDTGCGIQSEHLKRIFDPYFTNKSQGNGLGLVVIKHYLDKHGGKVLVESRVGSGSRFTISLPTLKIG